MVILSVRSLGLIGSCGLALAMLFPVASINAALIFQVGIDNNGTSEFEQESGGRNDRNYYWENGDYTGTVGLDGAGLNWMNGMEVWQDGPLSTDWANTIDGFPRAITTGWTTNNIFFQLDPSDIASGRFLLFELDVAGGAPGSTHDLDFRLNGNPFLSVVGANAATGLISSTIDPSTLGGGLTAGAAVLSWQRTGGSASGWITWDYVALSSVPEPASLLPLGLLLVAVGLLRFRKRVA